MKRIALLLLSSLVFLSCSKKSASSVRFQRELADTAYDESFVTSSKSWSGNGYNPQGPASLEETNPPVYSDMSNVIGDRESAEAGSQIQAEVIERKLIRSGNIYLQVSSLEDSAAALEAWVSKYNGYVSSSNQYSNSNNFTVRIPADKFDEAMNSISGIGKVKSRSVQAEDVTDSYYDLKTRLETKKLLREKYNQYLKKAENIKDLMEIERNLNNVISEIESMEGRLKLLTNQIDYSTISIYMETATPAFSPSYSINKIDFKRIGYNIVNFVIGLFKVLIYIIVYGIPILAVLFLFYWICFGKIGLIRKIFKRLSKKSTKEKE